jgi:succinate dehydrogenase assembly factor 1
MTTMRLVRWATSLAFRFERHGGHETKSFIKGGATSALTHPHDHSHNDRHHGQEHDHPPVLKHLANRPRDPSHPPTHPHNQTTSNQSWTSEQLASRAKRLSGLQLQVLSLYRGFLRVAKKKAKSEEEKQQALQYIRDRFRERAAWPKRDVDTIEAWVRRGKKQLSLLQLEGTDSISFWIRDIPQQQQQQPPPPPTPSPQQPPPSAPRPKSSCGGVSSSNNSS